MNASILFKVIFSVFVNDKALTVLSTFCERFLFCDIYHILLSWGHFIIFNNSTLYFGIFNIVEIQEKLCCEVSSTHFCETI